MWTALTITFPIIASFLNAIGILASSCTVTLNLVEWARERRLNTCDQILVALGISCTCYQTVRLAQLYHCFPWSDAPGMDYEAPILVQLRIWTESSSFWITACLCVFYCVKIVDFSHHIVFWVKLKITKVVPWILLGSVVGSFILSMPEFCILYGGSSQNTASNLTANSSLPGSELLSQRLYFYVSGFLGIILPLLFGIISVTLILMSLRQHTKKMKNNAAAISRPRLEAHFRAARMVGSLLLVFVFYLVAKMVILNNPEHSFSFFSRIVVVSTTPAQSIILILGNTKLKNRLTAVLCPWRQ
ncbi:taste receptor type 2 member 7-like [Ambystoma mexicanum]|uniref:taste receptor type 2 member 7-like n=1 Tax=Ambystoma mexicanum TaxID=8296 RepID=UPI0037E788E7